METGPVAAIAYLLLYAALLVAFCWGVVKLAGVGRRWWLRRHPEEDDASGRDAKD